MINSNAHETRMAIAVSMSFKCIRILNPVSIGMISTSTIFCIREVMKRVKISPVGEFEGIFV